MMTKQSTHPSVSTQWRKKMMVRLSDHLFCSIWFDFKSYLRVVGFLDPHVIVNLLRYTICMWTHRTETALKSSCRLNFRDLVLKSHWEWRRAPESISCLTSLLLALRSAYIFTISAVFHWIFREVMIKTIPNVWTDAMRPDKYLLGGSILPHLDHAPLGIGA